MHEIVCGQYYLVSQYTCRATNIVQQRLNEILRCHILKVRLSTRTRIHPNELKKVL